MQQANKTWRHSAILFQTDLSQTARLLAVLTGHKHWNWKLLNTVCRSFNFPVWTVRVARNFSGSGPTLY